MTPTFDPTTQSWCIEGERSRCVYNDARTQERRYRLPMAPVSRADFAELLARGDRRAGRLFYGAACAHCSDCIGIRIPVGAFVPSTSQKRVWKKGGHIQTEIGPVLADAERARLFDAHEEYQGLRQTDDNTPMTVDRYRATLADSWVHTFEMRYLSDGKLIGVAITDIAANACNAVYTYYDPAYAKYSLGTLSILRQIELTRRMLGDSAYLYLGLWVSGNTHMDYKTRFFPHERLLGGWQRFARTET